MRISYNALFEYAEDGITVSFPDIPSAITCGFNKKQAVQMAKDVLILVLHGEKAANLPKPTEISHCELSERREAVKITVRMRKQNGILRGKNVTELLPKD